MLVEDADWSPITKAILAACFEVHRILGPGLLESIYEEALAAELLDRGISFLRQYPIPVLYKGKLTGDFLRPDFVVAGRVILEIKAVEKLIPVHEAQVITYLKITDAPAGLLVNFHTASLKSGIRRLLHPRVRARIRSEADLEHRSLRDNEGNDDRRK